MYFCLLSLEFSSSLGCHVNVNVSHKLTGTKIGTPPAKTKWEYENIIGKCRKMPENDGLFNRDQIKISYIIS